LVSPAYFIIELRQQFPGLFFVDLPVPFGEVVFPAPGLPRAEERLRVFGAEFALALRLEAVFTDDLRDEPLLRARAEEARHLREERLRAFLEVFVSDLEITAREEAGPFSLAFPTPSRQCDASAFSDASSKMLRLSGSNASLFS